MAANKHSFKIYFFLLILMLPILCNAAINAGVSKTDITPPLGTPSAGYMERKGAGMQGVHDPLLAIALYIDNGEKKIVFCSVDNLGFTYEMVQEIVQRARLEPQLEQCEIYIASSHTHSGGGAYLNIPLVGENLAGVYSSEITEFYIGRTVQTIVHASQSPIPAKVGIGYGKAGEFSKYRGKWPIDVAPLCDIAMIKVTHLDDTPLAVLFNYPVHPTVLKSQNLLFSADFVGYARDHLQTLLGDSTEVIYFNGAQGDIIPKTFDKDSFDACDSLGQSLAEAVLKIWNKTETQSSLSVQTQRVPYAFKPQATPFGLAIPIDNYQSELNLIVLNELHAFVTIPGELSCIYDRRLKEFALELGYQHLSIFGLTNDAHGYIILPESWKHKTFESGLSFGGKDYGELTLDRAENLLEQLAPQ